MDNPVNNPEQLRANMTVPVDPTQGIWQSVLTQLTADDRITPQLHGFISLVEPRGVMAGTLYLEVPNELTRGMLDDYNKRWTDASRLVRPQDRRAFAAAMPFASHVINC